MGYWSCRRYDPKNLGHFDFFFLQCIITILAPYSTVITTHNSLQKRAMHTKKSAVYCDNDSTLNLVHTKNFSMGKHTGVSGELHHN